MSFSLMGLLGLDNIYLPIEIARKVTRAISGKEGKSTELNFANWVCFVMLTILYLNHSALLSGAHSG